MQATLTLTDGTSPLSFTYRATDASGVITWTAPSPQGDLAGVIALTRQSQKTRAGIVSRATKLTVPVYNSTTGKYTGSIQGRVVLNAPSDVSLAAVEAVVLQLVNAFAKPSNASFVSDYVNAI